MGGVPSVPTDPTRRIQVIGAGFSRTGTVSMTMALEKLLDGPVMHGGTQLLGREDAYIRLWASVFEAKFKDDKELTLKLLRKATAGFVAITDVPGNCLISELQELYPEAIVIVVNRDKHKWFKSIEMVSNAASPPWLRYFLAPVPGWRWFVHMIDCFIKADSERLPGTLRPDTLIDHNEWVRDHTPPDKFYAVELKDGWAPLCRILSRPVPDVPFPRANDADAVAELSKRIFVQTLLVWVGIFAGAALAGYIGWHALSNDRLKL